MDPELKKLLEALGVSTDLSADQMTVVAAYGSALSAGLKVAAVDRPSDEAIAARDASPPSRTLTADCVTKPALNSAP